MVNSIKRWNWRLVGIFLLALGLRVINLSTRSIQYDDAFSYFLSRQSWSNIISGTAADTMPPLYYFLLHLWIQVSQEIGWLRLLSIILNLVGVYFLYLLVKSIAGRTAGYWATFLASISPLQIYHAQDLRMYALLASAQLGYCYFFLAANSDENPRWVSWVGLILCGTVAMYSHNLAVFVLLVPNVYLLIKRAWKRLMRLFIAQAVIGALALPWLLLVPAQIEKIQQAFWTPKPGLVEIIQTILMMTTNLPLEGAWLMVGAVLSIELIVLVFWFAFRYRARNMQFLLYLFFVPPVILFTISYLMRPVFVPRGFLASTMAYLGLSAVVIAQTQKKWFKGFVAGSFILAAVVALPYQLNFDEFPRSPFRAAIQSIGQQIQIGERIVHDNKLSFFPSFFYAPDLNQHFIADEPGSFNDTYAPVSQKAIGLLPDPSIELASGDAPGVYFVTFQKTIDEYQSAGFSNHPNLMWLSDNYSLATKKPFGDLWVYYFKRGP